LKEVGQRTTIKSLLKGKTIVVMVDRPKLFLKLIRLLNRLGIRYTVDLSVDDNQADLVIVSKGRSGNGNVMTVCEELVSKEMLFSLELLRHILKINIYNKIIMGIDPGERIGVAVIGDGVFVYGTVLVEVNATIELIKQLIEYSRARSILVRIGMFAGGSRIAVDLAKTLGHSNVRIELVDERHVSSLAKICSKILGRASRNIVSAYAIAIAGDKGLSVSIC